MENDWQRERIERARAQLEEAFDALGQVCREAPPKTPRLEARIALGERYMRDHPEDMRSRIGLDGLRDRLRQLRLDEAEQARLRDYEAALAGYEQANDRYLALLAEARLYGVREEGEVA